MERQSQIGILSDRIGPKSARLVDRCLAERANGSRDDRNGVDTIIGATVEIEAADVFEALEAGDPCLKIAHARVSGYGSDARIRERLNEQTQRVGLKLRVGIEEDNDLVGRRCQGAREGTLTFHCWPAGGLERVDRRPPRRARLWRPSIRRPQQ